MSGIWHHITVGTTVLLLLSTGTLLPSTLGQGLYATLSTILGSNNPTLTVRQQYSNSKAWRNSYNLKPKSACSQGVQPAGSRTGNNLCAASAAGAQSQDLYIELLLATSPQAYNSAITSDTGGLHLAGAVGNQDPCNTCIAFAVTSAAELAVASVQHVDIQQVSISPQGLYFCTDIPRDCTAGWTLPAALQQLQERARQILTTKCLPYNPDPVSQLTPQRLCQGRCAAVQPFARQGNFSFKQISNVPAAQQHIRQFGGVVTRFTVYDDFRLFFANKANAHKVYKPGKGARPAFEHAVVLVGYDNDHQYWVVKNSWGDDWADHGYFRVAFGACSVLTPTSGEAYGVMWTSANPWKLPVTQSNIADCYWYTAQAGDYPSKIALTSRVPLDVFMLNNTAYITDLDKPLTGIKVLLCNPGEVSLSAPALPGYTCTTGMNYAGTDLQTADKVKTSPVAAVNACAAACTSRSDCSFFVFNTAHQCWMKKDLLSGPNGATGPDFSVLAACKKLST